MVKTYRTDIDGLRAISVISVILFHLGFLQNGYLGVDVFFVISGYLITNIVFGEASNGKFSIIKFYERRARRILPLTILASLIALILGCFFMLPDDLENLAQSVLATNFSINNILMFITSNNYWALSNDYKPLMHTWSLGIEEQFYLFYPIIFIIFSKEKIKYILPILTLLTLISILLFLSFENYSHKFYFLQFRFFELSIGGICSIYFNRTMKDSKINLLILMSVLLFILILLFQKLPFTNELKVILTTILTSLLLVFGAGFFDKKNLYSIFLTNKLITGIGKISFSIYIWHQIIFSFTRYCISNEIRMNLSIVLMIVTLSISILTYFCIEKIFRDRTLFSSKKLILLLGVSMIIINGLSFYIYLNGGVIKDVPELGIIKSNKKEFWTKTHITYMDYNERIRSLDKPFKSKGKIKLLVIGDSYGRDFSNILLESKFNNNIELSYAYTRQDNLTEINKRICNADFVFYATQEMATKSIFKSRTKNYLIDIKKIYIVGSKDFGVHNGVFYNRNNELECGELRTKMRENYLEKNTSLKKEWGNRYIDLISLVSNKEGEVLVFTPNCKFISIDTEHLTEFGAKYFAEKLNDKFTELFENDSK